jgi:hypothetical protein
MGTVRAKFTCTGVEPNGATNSEDKGAAVYLTPVVGGSPENESFYKWTPGGNIMLSTINEAAAAQFERGKEYYVDFTPAE